LDKVTTVTNEFFKVCPSRNIIGVTGTKGKGTTSTLITKMLEADGRRVHLGGNIGTPPLDLLKDGIEPDDWIVLELANFQLIDLKYSPHIAVCLMVAPEHLDWHADAEEYYNAKKQLFERQTAQDIAIYFADNEISKKIASVGQSQKIPYFAAPGAEVKGGEICIAGQKICDLKEIKLAGKHNWQNICAAVTAIWQATENIEAIRSVVTSFSGLPFRIELRREVNGVRFYNDSFASSPPTPLAAIDTVQGPKIVIIGGFDRHLELEELVNGIVKSRDQLRKVLLIGASAKRVAEALTKGNFKNFEIIESKSMNEIVKRTAETAQPGDAVVFSPGFPSFDMFKNFEDRGIQFNQAVEEL
jgi:UDP-N-acetylmuramoylalanine--D-glutamate ligase